MSVPKGKRNLSTLEFFHRAYRLNDDLTRLLLRDFGVKRVSKDLRSFTYAAKMTGEDRNQYMAICQRYGIDVEIEYPMWLVEYYRNWILQLLKDMLNHITIANTIRPAEPNYDYWFNLRRQHQQMAIAACFEMVQAIQTAARNLPVDYEKLMPYAQQLRAEIELLKAWRKSDNKRYSARKG